MPYTNHTQSLYLPLSESKYIICTLRYPNHRASSFYYPSWCKRCWLLCLLLVVDVMMCQLSRRRVKTVKLYLSWERLVSIGSRARNARSPERLGAFIDAGKARAWGLHTTDSCAHESMYSNMFLSHSPLVQVTWACVMVYILHLSFFFVHLLVIGYVRKNALLWLAG